MAELIHAVVMSGGVEGRGGPGVPWAPILLPCGWARMLPLTRLDSEPLGVASLVSDTSPSHSEETSSLPLLALSCSEF